MDEVYKFPRHADVIAEEAAKTLSLPFEARFMRLMELIAASEAFSVDSNAREAHRRIKERSEAEWQQAHREVFNRYGQ
ncbi:MAG TPA: hypothetical protein VH120_18225 [Gemmataceae bacterium]|nr:hypothetical protein [Gemmataceae bacterium]